MKGEAAETGEGVDRVEYLSFEQLGVPSTQAIAREAISLGFNSPEWFIQFQALSTIHPIQPTCARPTNTTRRSF